MAAMIETEHRGYKIHYSENEDVWRAYALDVAGATLTAVKRKVDAIERKTRSVESIPAFHVAYRGNVCAGIITAKVGKTATGRHLYWDRKDAVWFVNAESKSRSRVELKELIEDTSENRAKLEEWRRLSAIAHRAELEAKAALEAIPRMSVEAMPAADPESEE